MKSLNVLEISNPEQIVKYLHLSSNNCTYCYYYMDDENTSNPIIRKLEDYEIKEHMCYSFEKNPFGWAWKSNSDNIMSVIDLAQSIFEIINKDYINRDY